MKYFNTLVPKYTSVKFEKSKLFLGLNRSMDMKSLMIFLFCLSLIRLEGQVNCPIFPHAKKEKIRLKGGAMQLSNFVNTFAGLAFKESYWGILNSGIGISKQINKTILKFDIGGAKDFTNNYGYSHWAVGAGYYFYDNNKAGWRLEATLHRFADESVLYLPTVQMVRTRKGKFLFGDFNYGLGYNRKSVYLQIGLRWGITI